MSQRSPVIQIVPVVWATEGREPWLPPDRDSELTGYLRNKAGELGCRIIASGCAPDHVHVVARLRPSVSLATLAQRLKGASSHDLSRRGWPRPLRWQDRYWAESVSPHGLAGLMAYVSEQRARHDPSHPAERWLHHLDDGT